MATKNPQTPKIWELQQAVKGFSQLVIDSACRFCGLLDSRSLMREGVLDAELNLRKAVRKLKRAEKALEEAKRELAGK
jgi:hypothetical protein